MVTAFEKASGRKVFICSTLQYLYINFIWTWTCTVNLQTNFDRSYFIILKPQSCTVSIHWRQVPYRIVGRRPGDLATVYADAALAEKELAWKAQLNLDDMCKQSMQLSLNRERRVCIIELRWNSIILTFQLNSVWTCSSFEHPWTYS